MKMLEDFVVVIFMFAVFGVLIAIVFNAVRDEAVSDWSRPCINGILYARTTSYMVPLIDPKTMKPQLCEVEK